MKRTTKNTNVIERRGFNAFGEPCIERIVTLEKETAIEQYIEIAKVLKATTKIIEYTLFYKNFSQEEIEKFQSVMLLINRKYGI